MWTYSTNMMGPMNHWYEENKIPFKIIKRKSTLFGKEIEFKKYTPIYLYYKRKPLPSGSG